MRYEVFRVRVDLVVEGLVSEGLRLVPVGVRYRWAYLLTSCRLCLRSV